MFENLGPALALLRNMRKLSQAEVARKAGMGKSQLSKYEGGRELPKLDSLERVLNVYQVGADGFFSVVRAIDDWEAGPQTPLGSARIPATGLSDADQAFMLVFSDLLLLQKAMLRLLIRPSADRTRIDLDAAVLGLGGVSCGV